ncbi:MAG: hypothetical protein HDR25_07695 [Lachnospiraceae bacterium]|nr:hypothetical protein [Lachnospiraceae bacterium]
MKPIIFARIADMKYYKGITENDKPSNGGSYVKDTQNAHECYNFDPIPAKEQDYEKCIGFSQMSGGRGVRQLHIENICGCELLKNENVVNDVYVVFVSKAPGSKTMRVVGFYKNATVYRYPHFMPFGEDYEQQYQYEARKENCILLPYTERHTGNKWFVPASSAKHQTFGFGRINLWYAAGKGASKEELEYVERMLESIDTYEGENWMDKEVQ